MQPCDELLLEAANDTTMTTAITATAARTPLTIHFSRSDSCRLARTVWAWPGGSMSTARV